MEMNESEKAMGWRKRQMVEAQINRYEENKTMIEKKTCQVCRLRPAETQGKNSRGAPQWRCITCHELKNRLGFTKGKS